MALPKRVLTPENHAKTIIEERPVPRALRDLNFKVPHAFKKRFALRAVEDDMSQVELLRRAFDAYEQLDGGQ